MSRYSLLVTRVSLLEFNCVFLKYMFHCYVSLYRTDTAETLPSPGFADFLRDLYEYSYSYAFQPDKFDFIIL